MSARRLRGCTGAVSILCNIHVRLMKKGSFLSSEQQDVFTRNKSKVIRVGKAVLKMCFLNIRQFSLLTVGY